MKRKIHIRLIGIALIAILVTLLGVTSIYYHLFETQVETDLHTLAETLADSGIFTKENVTKISLRQDKIRVTWIDADGDVLYDSYGLAEDMENHGNRPEVKEALAKGEGESVRTSDTLQVNTYYYALRMEDGTVLRTSVSANSGMNILLQAMPVILVIIGFIMVLCVWLADYLTKKLMKPIVALSESLDQVPGTMVQDEVYKELEPFVQTIRAQHENILAGAKMRQDFTANVSHELKTPLTAISGYAELIENKMVTPEQEVAFAGEIRKNSDRLLTLINDIIRLSELDNCKEYESFETVDLYALAKECSDNLVVSASRRKIDFTLEGSECIIRGNRHMIRELIDNLCENAIRYNNEGGMVRLEIGKKDGRPFLTVTDNGIGIPKEHQERVFERFYRVDKSRSKETGGTGLGLAIVKHIAAIHEAELVLESEEGKGTKITVIF
ncbi:MAG: ATP-binding protein [Agathobacter sp.]